MANINLTTGKICGAKKGSETYWHEVGHKVFEEKAINGNLIRVIQDMTLKSILFLVALYVLQPFFFFKVLITICLLANTISEIYEEKWCWNYAKTRMGKKKDDERTKRNKTNKV